MTDQPKYKVLTKEPPGSPEWLEAHKGVYGSNDLATIMGVEKFGRSKIKLWGEMTGKLQREDISQRPEVRRGILLEPVVLGLFAAETKKEILPTPGLVQHPTIPYFAVTPDALTDAGATVVEAKTVGLHRRRDWNADVPLHVQIQGQAMCWVLGLAKVTFAAFCLDAEADDQEDEEAATKDSLLLWAERDRRDDLIDVMGNELTQFHENHVLKDIPPEPGGDFAVVKALFPRHDPGKVHEFSAEWEIPILRTFEIASAVTALGKEQKELKAKIALEMGDAEYAKTPGGVVLRNRVEPRKSYVVQASEPRVLRKVSGVGK